MSWDFFISFTVQGRKDYTIFSFSISRNGLGQKGIQIGGQVAESVFSHQHFITVTPSTGLVLTDTDRKMAPTSLPATSLLPGKLPGYAVTNLLSSQNRTGPLARTLWLETTRHSHQMQLHSL